MPAFESLSHQKRGSEDHIARRQSMTDQHVKGGIFSTFFHKFVRLSLPYDLKLIQRQHARQEREQVTIRC